MPWPLVPEEIVTGLRQTHVSVLWASFERVLSLVALGEVGIFGSREVSRLSRTDKDWCRLLEVCQMFDRRGTAWRTRYALLGAVVVLVAAGVFGWRFLGARGDVLKPAGGAGRDRDGFRARLFARSASLWLETSK